jgi:ribosome-associated protein
MSTGRKASRPKLSASHPGLRRAASAELDVAHGDSALVARVPPQRETGRQLALMAAAAGLEKKAEDVQIIDVRGKVDYADYIVLMTGQSDRNVAAIARGVEEDLHQQGIRALALEGLPLARWVLIDFVDVVVHVFQAEWRGVYDLDGLWMDAARVAVPESGPARSEISSDTRLR